MNRAAMYRIKAPNRSKSAGLWAEDCAESALWPETLQSSITRQLSSTAPP